MQNFSCLYVNKAYMNLRDLQRVIQSCVFTADSVYLSNSMAVDPSLPKDAIEFIQSRVTGLHEIGAIKFWAIEGQTEFLNSVSPSTNLRSKADVTIPREAYLESYSFIIERLMECRKEFVGVEASGSFDGITEMVLGKHVLWTFALRDALEVENVLLDYITDNNLAHFFMDLLSLNDIEQRTVEEVSDRLQLPDLSQLTLQQIAQCREYLPRFRANLQSKIGLLPQDVRLKLDEIVRKVAHEIVDEFWDYMKAQAKRACFPAFVIPKGHHWGLLERFIPCLIKQSLEKLFEWRDKASPQLLLMELMNLKSKFERLQR